MQHVAVVALVEPTPDTLALLADRATAVPVHDLSASANPSAVPATHVVLLGESRHEAAVRRHAAALADRGPAVAWRALPHGPGAIALIASQVGAVTAGGGDAGLAVAFVDTLTPQAWSAAWLPSVARLEHPAPSVGQHLRSWGPAGDGFVATFSGPDPRVRRVGAVAGADAPAVERGAVYCAAVAELSDAAQADVLALSGGSHLVDLPGLRVSPAARTGSARAVELVALPALDRLTVGRSAGPCPICGAVLVAAFCTYCHVRRAEGDAQRGAVE